MKLSEDLTEAVSEPRTLWRASDYKEVVNMIQGEKTCVTDGPFLYRVSNEELYCIWSSFNKNGYTELLSKSDNGDIDGNWTVCEKPLFSNDGGHGMIFKDFHGNACFIMHKPNVFTLERPVIMEMPVLHK